MLRKLKDSEKGFTLVELLAVLAILSLVILLAGSIHLFGQKQFAEQTDQVETVNDVRYILASIEKDIRQTKPEEVKKNKDKLVIGSSTYYKSRNGTTLFKDSLVLSDKIKTFEATVNQDSVEIKIAGTADSNSEATELSTTIYFRR